MKSNELFLNQLSVEMGLPQIYFPLLVPMAARQDASGIVVAWTTSSSLAGSSSDEQTFVENNPLGVLDHTVTLASGQKLHNPMRVIPNAEGSEVLFTLLQTANMDERKFTDDCHLVENDLRTLKRVPEARHGK